MDAWGASVLTTRAIALVLHPHTGTCRVSLNHVESLTQHRIADIGRLCVCGCNATTTAAVFDLNLEARRHPLKGFTGLCTVAGFMEDCIQSQSCGRAAHTVILHGSHLLSNVVCVACPAQLPLFLVAAYGCNLVRARGTLGTTEHVLHTQGFPKLPASMLRCRRL